MHGPINVKHRFLFANFTADRKLVQFRKRALNGQFNVPERKLFIGLVDV